jgi:hypothetical protein
MAAKRISGSSVRMSADTAADVAEDLVEPTRLLRAPGCVGLWVEVDERTSTTQ